MPRASTPSTRERGMTLIEALISLLLLSLIMVAFLGILDSTSRLAKVQTNIADATEGLRFSVAALVRMVRMAGTGGIPLVAPGATLADPPIAMALIVEDSTTLAAGSLRGNRLVVEGTDVLRIRGVMASQLYEIRGEDSLDLASNQIMVPDVSPYPPAGTRQELRFPSTPQKRPILISLQRPLDITTTFGSNSATRHYNDYRVVEVADDSDAIPSFPAPVNGVVWMTIKVNTAGDAATLNPGGAYQAPDEELAYATGFIDDFIFFISNNEQGEPSLYRFPGSGTSEELVSNISNLQVALGCDLDLDGEVDDSEWFGTRDNPTMPTTAQLNALRDVRLSLVARTAAPDQSFVDATTMPENAPDLSTYERSYRHRVITVRIGLRSHPGLEAT